MSQAERKRADVEMGDRTGAHVAWPSQAGSNFGNGSGPLFSIYSNLAEKEDNKVAERWQKDAQGILIFTGLFSIVVAILVTMSVQDLRPRSRDDSAFYLQNIYQLLANPSVFDALNPPPAVVTPPPFSPPGYAIWVNSLWFLSLAISLTSALLATMLHQWTRRYLTITQPIQSSPHKRARIRAFFANGIDKLHLPWVIEALPTLMHLSLSLFLAGLLIFLFNVNQTAFNAVVGWVALFAGVYACITFMPIFRYDSPFYAPLSSTAWFLYAGTLYAVFRVLSLVTGGRDNFRDLTNRYREWVLGGVEKAAEDTVSDWSSKTDGRVLDWMIGTMCEEDMTERFFEAMPGFCGSKLVPTHLPSLLRTKIRNLMDAFLDRTFSSESVSESTKIGRLTICLNAAHAALGPLVVSRTIGNVFEGRWREAPQSIEMGYALRRWCNNRDDWIAAAARRIVAGIIAVQRRDDRWIELAEGQFGLPGRVLRDNIPYGDSVLLVILLHVTHSLFHSDIPHWDPDILQVLSQFDIRNTLPQLQHDFCALWNDIVRQARNRRPYSRPFFILREIRHLYATLHEGIYSPPTGFSTTLHGNDFVWDRSSYPLCTIVSHTSVPPPHIPTSAVPAVAVPHFHPALAHMPRFMGPNVPRFPTPSWGTTSRLLTEASFSDMPDAPQQSIPVSLESQPLSITSLDIAAAGATQGDPDTSTDPQTRPTPQPIPRDGSGSQRSEEMATVPSPVVSDLAPPPIPIPTVIRADSADIPPNLESPQPQSEDMPRALGSLPSSSSLARPPLASALDPQVTGTTTAHDVVPIEAFHQLRISAVGDPDISESTSRPEDPRRESNQSSLRVTNGS